MKHAGPTALNALADLIASLRERSELKEPRPGVFYRKGKAFLHFHEDASGFFADLRVSAAWERFRVSREDERATFLSTVERSL